MTRRRVEPGDSGSWIVIPNWDRFQHYSDRDPKWIKNYTELLSDDAYLGLTWQQRGALHAIWLAYARSHRQLAGSTSGASRQVGGRVSRATLIALNHAGFIHFSASKPLASRAPARSREESSKELSQETLPRRARKSGSRASDNGPAAAAICPECEVGAGEHAAGCSRATAEMF